MTPQQESIDYSTQDEQTDKESQNRNTFNNFHVIHDKQHHLEDFNTPSQELIHKLIPPQDKKYNRRSYTDHHK